MQKIAEQVKEAEVRGCVAAFIDAGLVKIAGQEEFDAVCSAVTEQLPDAYDMQKIAIDDPRMDKIYALCQDTCPLLLHMGDSRYHYDNPAQLPGVLRRFPRLRVIGAHMGGYTEWQQALDCLLQEDVLVDCSSSYCVLDREGLLQAIRAFGADRVMFGTDFPMWDPAREVQHVRGLGLTQDELDMDAFYESADAMIQEKYLSNEAYAEFVEDVKTTFGY